MRFGSRFRLAFVTAVMGLAVTGCSPEYEKTPERIRGLWTTTAEGYEGRYLRIEGTTVVFGVRAIQKLRHTVREVEPARSDKGPGYDLHCAGPEGREIRLELALDGNTGDILYLRNRPGMVWYRREDVR